jgi:EpsI family protein
LRGKPLGERVGADGFSVRDAALLGAILGALAIVYWEPLTGLVTTWSRSPMYSYGFGVPAVSAFLIWERRGLLRRIPHVPAPLAGGSVLAAAFALTLVGGAASIQTLQQIGFVLAIVGVVLLLFGRRFTFAIWAGLAYLLLMIPVWDVFTERLHWPFQLRSAEVGVAMLRAVGIPAHREGTIISLPNVTIEVARACSGVNYLVAVLALGLPVAYLYVDGLLRRAALIGFAVVIAAVSNSLRVALIGGLAYLEIGSPLHGPFHVLHGLFVAMIGYVALFVGLRWLGRAARPGTALTSSRAAWPRLSAPLAVSVIAALAGLGIVSVVQRPVAVALIAPLDALPLELGRWSGRPVSAAIDAPSAKWWRGSDATLQRRYLRADGAEADVFIGYFEMQRQGKELVSFLSAPLHEAASPLPIDLPGGGRLRANHVAEVEGRKESSVFWYELDGGTEANEYRAKARLLGNALLRRRTNGAVVMISSVVSSSGGHVAAAGDLEELAALVHQQLTATLPWAGAQPTRSVRVAAASRGLIPGTEEQGSYR